MKNIALLLSAFVVTVSLLSFAGDDPVQAIAYTSTQTQDEVRRPMHDGLLRQDADGDHC